MTASGPLLLLAAGGMEFSWLYAWATFLTSSILGRTFPLPEALGSFALAVALTTLSQERGWRVIAVLGLQLLGFVPAALRVARIFNSWSSSFSNDVNPEFFNATMGSSEWIVAMLLLLWGFLFWGSGVRLVRRPLDYLTLCSRLDLGLGAFFLLILAAFAGSRKGAGSAGWLVLPFFAFSLLSIALARLRSSDPILSSNRQRGVGVVLGFSVATLLLGAGTVSSSMPYLTGAARAGYGLLEAAWRPLWSALLWLCELLAKEGAGGSRVPLAKKKVLERTVDAAMGGWLESLAEAVAWFVRVLLGATVLAALCALAYFALRGLFAKTSGGSKTREPRNLSSLWARVQAFVGSVATAAARAVTGPKTAIQLYGALRGWGRRSGLPHRPSETPTEYGTRLRGRFPEGTQQIASIVDAFNREAYGEVPLGVAQLRAGCLAFRRLCSPAFWASRLKLWFLRPTD